MRPLSLLLFTTALTSSPANVNSFSTPASFSNNAYNRPEALETVLQSCSDNDISSFTAAADTDASSSSSSSSTQRRKILQTALTTPLVALTTTTTTTTLLAPQSASAASSEKPPPIIPLITTAKRLRAVPTFTIVDGNGVPFHTYDKDSAGGFGYFFTDYTSATYVLEDAQKAYAKAKSTEAAKKEDGEDDNGQGSIGDDGTGSVPDAWGAAQIVTLPLDVVLQLSVKKLKSVATNGKGKLFSTFYQVIPETNDLNAALKIENTQRYSERGRVPLFYVDGLTLPSDSPGVAAGSVEEGSVANPVYFRQSDLKKEWNKQYPEKELPTIKVRELNETFRAMIRPGGRDDSVKNLVFVPIPESVERARSAGRSYKLGQMILTK